MDNIYIKYVNCVKKCLEIPVEKWNFKSDSDYTYVLEHVSEIQGIEYLNKLKETDFFSSNIDLITLLCEINDNIGVPTKFKFKGFCTCSPTNLRYLYHSFLILTEISKNTKSVDIIEIGGGYGGLSFFITKLSHVFNLVINSYIIFDLPEVCLLQKKYIENVGIKVESFNLNETPTLKNESFLISNYAFSEISENIQKKYIDTIIPKCSHGFLTWNFIPVYQFTNKPLHIEEECPKTGHNNFYVRF